MSIKGSFKEISLPDVLQLLSVGHKTGCLKVTDGKNFGSIFFKDGKIVFYFFKQSSPGLTVPPALN